MTVNCLVSFFYNHECSVNRPVSVGNFSFPIKNNSDKDNLPLPAAKYCCGDLLVLSGDLGVNNLLWHLSIYVHLKHPLKSLKTP